LLKYQTGLIFFGIWVRYMHTDNKDLYLVTGFLGSGKTTLMKNLIHFFKDKKLGIIINEFGNVGVDGDILKSEGIAMSEINNGSIFCTCRSDMFVDSILNILKTEVEVILVETSGMSDPSAMPKILETVEKYNAYLNYKGCIGIVDATNVLKLVKTAKFVYHQIASASLLLINKTDRVTSDEIADIKEQIRKINPEAKIIETVYCKIDTLNMICNMDKMTLHQEDAFQTLSNVPTQKTHIRFDQSVEYDKFIFWLSEFSEKIFRIKGFVELDGKWYHVDGVNDNISLKNTKESKTRSELVIIYPNTMPLKHMIKKTGQKTFDGHLSCD